MVYAAGVAELKTKPTDASVEEFIASIDDPQKRADVETIAAIMAKATRSPGKMWGASIVGFGEYHYVYESGRENDWFLIGFSPRKKSRGMCPALSPPPVTMAKALMVWPITFAS